MFDVGVAVVRATLQYTVDDGQRHHYVACQPTAEERTAQSVPEDMSKNPINGVETIVCDGRGLNVTLGAHSLALKGTVTDLGGWTWISG